MSRYIRAEGWQDWEYDESHPPLLPHLDVDDTKVTFTGVYDMNGEPLYRVQPPIGFGNDKEWNN